MNRCHILLILTIVFFPAFSLGQKRVDVAMIPAMKVEELVAYYKKDPGVLVVNFWSTWCKPCIEEIPHFLSTVQRYKEEDVTLLLVSLDTRKLFESGELHHWLKKKKWEAPVVWLNETDADYYCPQVDARWSGVIPATVIINPSNGYYEFFEESMTAVALDDAIKKAITKER